MAVKVFFGFGPSSKARTITSQNKNYGHWTVQYRGLNKHKCTASYKDYKTRYEKSEGFTVYPGILETNYTWLETSVSKPDPDTYPDPDPFWEFRSGSNSNKFERQWFTKPEAIAATPSKGNNNVLILHYTCLIFTRNKAL